LAVIIVIIVATIWTLREGEEGASDSGPDGSVPEPASIAPAKPAATEQEASAVIEEVAPDTADQIDTTELASESKPAEAPVQPQPETRPDNLKRVSGIGPKIEKLLNDNGITTFAQLAQTDVSRLQALLDEAEYDLPDPTTWPERAQELASD